MLKTIFIVTSAAYPLAFLGVVVFTLGTIFQALGANVQRLSANLERQKAEGGEVFVDPAKLLRAGLIVFAYAFVYVPFVLFAVVGSMLHGAVRLLVSIIRSGRQNAHAHGVYACRHPHRYLVHQYRFFHILQPNFGKGLQCTVLFHI